jgi:hypothetical protein
MPPESPPARRRPGFDEIPATRRRLFYVYAVGRRSSEQRTTQRYLRIFQRFDTRQGLAGFLSWNWSSFFCTLPWLAHRQMPGLALIYFIVAYVFAPVQFVAWQQSCPGEKGIIPYAVLVGWLPFTFLLMPAISDWLYYRRARLIAIEAHERRYEKRIGTSASNAAKFAIGGPVVFLALLTLAGNYHPVPYRTQIGEAVQTASAARDAVAAFHAARGRLPRKGEIEPLASTPTVKSVTVGDAGAVTVVLGVRCFEGRSIIYTPVLAGGRITCKCSTPDIAFRFLPAECR